jgi:SOS response regulatory protein OraA/RecX
MLEKLTDKKLVELKSERNQLIKGRKAYKYLVQKGFERDMVIEIINSKLKSNTDKSIFP